MTKHDIKIILDDYIDMIYIYEIICNETYNYYYKLKVIFELPIIIINLIMTFINSTIVDIYIIKHSNIFLNIITMFLVSISNYLKVNEKCEILKINRDKFIKLYNLIEKRKYTEDISVDFIDIIITNYDNIIENINFSFPPFILKKIRDKYAEKKTLPLFINGIKKLDKYRTDNGIISPKITFENYNEKDDIKLLKN
jgi:hypothetical protein